MLIRALMLTSALVLAGPVVAQDNATPAAAAQAAITDPAQFAAMASVSNMFEIQSSELAMERAVSEEVKAFAQQMIADHTKAGDDMATAAGEEGVTPASELDQKHQDILNTLGSLEGEAFDAAYIEAQVQAHDEAVTLFEGFAANGSEGPLKAFAASTLPTLQQHQAHVHEMAAM
jgi:putative membrane protein